MASRRPPVPSPTYHTALGPEVGDTEYRIKHFALPDARGVAFVHDAFDPLPAEYDTVNAIYTEPPWRHGFPIFDSRAGVSPAGDRTWPGLMRALGEEVERRGRMPFVVILGKQALRYLPEPDELVAVVLHGRPALAACWRCSYAYLEGETTETVHREVLRDFGRVGDPFCGYGYLIPAAYEVDAHLVLSDHNAACIGHIARTWARSG